jgi:two-component sensor histidine kinase
MTPLRNREGQPVGFLNILRDNTRVQAEGERRALMLSEMSHRVKNALATVQAVALGTLRQAEVPMEVRRTLTDRIVALAQSHDLLAGEQCEGMPLAQVIERVLSPYGGSDRAVLSGADIRLPANTVEMLGLAFHELATNAAKHGALSVSRGRVEITWTTRRASKVSVLLEIVWREHDGPPVVPPTRRGFGSRLLERGIPHDFGGTATLDFYPEGLECRISLPVTSAR